MRRCEDASDWLSSIIIKYAVCWNIHRRQQVSSSLFIVSAWLYRRMNEIFKQIQQQFGSSDVLWHLKWSSEAPHRTSCLTVVTSREKVMFKWRICSDVWWLTHSDCRYQRVMVQVQCVLWYLTCSLTPDCRVSRSLFLQDNKISEVLTDGVLINPNTDWEWLKS